MTDQRTNVARKACDDEATKNLMGDAATGKLTWEQVANMLACNLQQAHYALNDISVYDYEAQQWLHPEE